MSKVAIRSVQKSFGANTVVRDFDLTIGEGEFISLLGPSGCGKTTVLRMVAGFETPTRGTIEIDGQDVTAQRPNQRKIGMMFQSYALFPNLTVAGNVGFGLKVAGLPREKIAARVDEMLATVGLKGFGARYPYQLSGGQQQRVALARAIAPQPRVLLLDEPLSALDAKIRVSLRAEIRAIQRQLGISTLFVTHDQEEAMAMSDRVVVMTGGKADQVGTPAEIYSRPATRFVAEFIGALNVLQGVVTDPANGQIDTAAGPVQLGRPVPRDRGAALALGIRPEGLRLVNGADPEGPLFIGRLVSRDFLGPIIRLRAQTEGGTPLVVDCFNRDGADLPQPGAPIRLTVRPEEVVLLD
ncbi:ABC transporter ATP-binding protein [Neotabrizicola shimadae]|uniref:ABC transporter ATP-binding protein n=1 Tax=Neotabrizicola shimadae TaxID=2807096 RepID=A0A8G0ZTV6_9RHOB|nr:ABC transporter ATP-binding protein [Neotabrizicola shimadae]QYZ70023.1 ABC transporter ATP-binding protein [Neotabrizicola shimadae]